MTEKKNSKITFLTMLAFKLKKYEKMNKPQLSADSCILKYL